jgi:hypothetical protein
MDQFKGREGRLKGNKSFKPGKREERIPKDQKAHESKRPDPDLNRQGA